MTSHQCRVNNKSTNYCGAYVCPTYCGAYVCDDGWTSATKDECLRRRVGVCDEGWTSAMKGGYYYFTASKHSQCALACLMRDCVAGIHDESIGICYLFSMAAVIEGIKQTICESSLTLMQVTYRWMELDWVQSVLSDN